MQANFTSCRFDWRFYTALIVFLIAANVTSKLVIQLRTDQLYLDGHRPA